MRISVKCFFHFLNNFNTIFLRKTSLSNLSENMIVVITRIFFFIYINLPLSSKGRHYKSINNIFPNYPNDGNSLLKYFSLNKENNVHSN